jgi:hypothetical protein
MSTKHSLTRARQVYVGDGYDPGLYGRNGRSGVPVNFITKVALGTPLLAVAAGIVNGATGGTEAPNNSTITITADTQGTSPLDPSAALSSTTINNEKVMELDVPRNVTAAINTAVGTVTIVVSGYDEYRVPMRETLSIAIGGTAAAGKKAFKWIRSIALTSTANETAKAINVGFGDVLGLPYRITAKSDVLSVWLDDAVDSATVVIADSTSPATATTGDVRGTVDPNGALNGTKTLVAYLCVANPNTAVGLRGVDQFSG